MNKNIPFAKKFIYIFVAVALMLSVVFVPFSAQKTVSASTSIDSDSLGSYYLTDNSFHTSSNYAIVPSGVAFLSRFSAGTRVYFEVEYLSYAGTDFCLTAYFGYPTYVTLYFLYRSGVVAAESNVVTTVSDSFLLIPSPTGLPMNLFYCWNVLGVRNMRMWCFTDLGEVIDLYDSTMNIISDNTDSVVSAYYSDGAFTYIGIALLFLLGITLFLLLIVLIKKLIMRGE